MQLPENIKNTITDIYNVTNPETVFLYGSYARGDNIKESDYEIGILYKDETRVKREDLAKMHTILNLHLYSFPSEEFIKYEAQIPFTKAIYFRELLEKGAITLLGKPILEQIKPPQILISDVLSELSFDKGRALSALLSFRQNDMYSATDHLIKSSFYASRMFLLLERKIFVLRSDKILQQLQACRIGPNHLELIEYILSLRNKKVIIDLKKIFENISYINFIFEQAHKKYKNDGDIIVLV